VGMWLIPSNGRGLPKTLEANDALTLGSLKKRDIAVALELLSLARCNADNLCCTPLDVLQEGGH
jgi:hypothetical protein